MSEGSKMGFFKMTTTLSMAFLVTGSGFKSTPLGCGRTGDLHLERASEKSAGNTQCTMSWTRISRGMFLTCLIHAMKS